MGAIFSQTKTGTMFSISEKELKESLSSKDNYQSTRTDYVNIIQGEAKVPCSRLSASR